MPLLPLLLCLQDIAGLASQLAAGEIDVRAEAEARLKSVDPVHVKDLRVLRDNCRDVEARARLDVIVLGLLRRDSARRYEGGDVPGCLRALAEAEGRDRSAEAQRRLKASSMPWEPRNDPLLPWAYPALIRGLAPGASGDAAVILLKLGDQAVPALCWALRTSTPSIRLQACVILGETRTVRPLALAALEEAATSSDADLRVYARQTLRRLDPK